MTGRLIHIFLNYVQVTYVLSFLVTLYVTMTRLVVIKSEEEIENKRNRKERMWIYDSWHNILGNARKI
jgi:hypothetical protein